MYAGVNADPTGGSLLTNIMKECTKGKKVSKWSRLTKLQVTSSLFDEFLFATRLSHPLLFAQISPAHLNPLPLPSINHCLPLSQRFFPARPRGSSLIYSFIRKFVSLCPYTCPIPRPPAMSAETETSTPTRRALFTTDELLKINADLAGKSPQEILTWAIDNIPEGGLWQTTAFGL